MADLEFVIAGLALLYTEDFPETRAGAGDGYAEGEVAFIVPDKTKTTSDVMATAGKHNPLLIVRRDQLAGVDGPDEQFPLEGAIDIEGLEGGTDFRKYVAWSLIGSTLWILDDKADGLKFHDEDAKLDVVKTPVDWSPVGWIPRMIKLLPALRLDSGWRNSPHIGATFLLGSGEIASASPLQPGVGLKLFSYGHESDTDRRIYSDGISYRTSIKPASIVIDRGDKRSIIRLNADAGRVWLLNLDDKRRSDPSYDHFTLYGLLPWNLTSPKLKEELTGADHTGDQCWSVWYRK